jgi:hypothetical protein
MNFRTINDKGETIIHEYRTPSKIATTLPRVKSKPSRAERRANRRLDIALSGMVAHQNNKMISHTPTRPGAMKHY